MEKMQEIFTKDLQELKNRDEQHTRRNKATEAEQQTNELQDRRGGHCRKTQTEARVGGNEDGQTDR